MEGTGKVLHPPLSRQGPTKSVRSQRGFYTFRDRSYTFLHNFLAWSHHLALRACTGG